MGIRIATMELTKHLAVSISTFMGISDVEKYVCGILVSAILSHEWESLRAESDKQKRNLTKLFYIFAKRIMFLDQNFNSVRITLQLRYYFSKTERFKLTSLLHHLINLPLHSLSPIHWTEIKKNFLLPHKIPSK